MDFKLKKSNLNFRVYTASSLPNTGNENDICVISDVPMKNWILSPDVPSGAPRTDGDVWVQYSVTGNTLNVLKNGTMLIAAISAKQYVDGAWVTKPAEIYQNGNWGEIMNILLGGGNNTLGIPNFVSKSGTASGSNLTRTATQNNDGTMDISVKTASGYWTNTVAVFPVNVSTEDKTLTISLVCTSKSSSVVDDSVRIYLYSDSNATTSLGNKTVFTCNSAQLNETYTVDMDISATGSFYVGVWCSIANASTGTMTVKVKEIKTG